MINNPFLYYSPLVIQYQNQWKNTVLHGNIFELIYTFPDNFFFCSIFSPPYFHCRSYQTKPIILGGNKQCQHEWKFYTFKGKSGGVSLKTKIKGKENFQWVEQKQNGICFKCGATFCEFGQEPFVNDTLVQFEKYPQVLVKGFCSHLIDLCDLILQKTRKDGILWLNIADTFYSHGADKVIIGGKPLKYEFMDSSLCGIPNRVCNGLIDKGYANRNEVIWEKDNGMPSSQSNRFTINFEKWFFFTKNTDPIYWINEKTCQMVITPPQGTNGKENIDWEWRLCNKCIQDIVDEPKKLTNFLSGLQDSLWTSICKTNDMELFLSAIGNLSSTQLQSLHFTSICGNKTCNEGKRKQSCWISYAYYFNQLFEPLKNAHHKVNKFGGNKHVQNQQYNTNAGSYSGKPYNALDHLHGKTRRAIFRINTKPSKYMHFASYSKESIQYQIESSIPQYFCTQCGLPRIPIYEFEKTDPIEIYAGLAQKDYHSAMAQNPSNTKRRILESMRKIRKLKGYSQCICEKPHYISAFGFDPFAGSGTTFEALIDHRLDYIGTEINHEYIQIIDERLKDKKKIQRIDNFYHVVK